MSRIDSDTCPNSSLRRSRSARGARVLMLAPKTTGKKTSRARPTPIYAVGNLFQQPLREGNICIRRILDRSLEHRPVLFRLAVGKIRKSSTDITTNVTRSRRNARMAQVRKLRRRLQNDIHNALPRVGGLDDCEERLRHRCQKFLASEIFECLRQKHSGIHATTWAYIILADAVNKERLLCGPGPANRGNVKLVDIAHAVGAARSTWHSAHRTRNDVFYWFDRIQ